MGLELVELADGFSCYLTGPDEAGLVYKEIFVDHCYDIAELSETPFIVDAGANIGLFSIYMKQKYPSAKIIAFEPAPESFEGLGKNLELHKVATNVITYPYGLGTKSGEAKITYYPTSPANSTFYPETKELQKTLTTVVLGQGLSDKFYGNESVISVPINRLSHFLTTDHADVTKIDLLKVDVEGAELDVLGGIDDTHWAQVRNVVTETTNAKGEVAEIEGLLRSKGFEVTTSANNMKFAEVEQLLQAKGFEVLVKDDQKAMMEKMAADLMLYLIVGRRPSTSD